MELVLYNYNINTEDVDSIVKIRNLSGRLKK